jgi:hypothetical protein
MIRRRPGQCAQVDPSLILKWSHKREARSDPEPLGWRQKMLSTRTASLATAGVTGVSTTAASAMGHLPPSLQAAFNSAATILTLWQVHKSNPKHDDDND